jgi:hypothetical protein
MLMTQFRRKHHPRRGSATMDYVLVLGAMFSMSAICVSKGRQIMQLAYDMINVLISWPFL